MDIHVSLRSLTMELRADSILAVSNRPGGGPCGSCIDTCTHSRTHTQCEQIETERRLTHTPC